MRPALQDLAGMREIETMNTNEVILLKYGEIVLKGLNRNYFNQLLLTATLPQKVSTLKVRTLAGKRPA